MTITMIDPLRKCVRLNEVSRWTTNFVLLLIATLFIYILINSKIHITGRVDGRG